MPSTLKRTSPSYSLHSSGQAVVTFHTTSGNCRDLSLGPWDSTESKAEYAHDLGVLSTNGGRYPEPQQPILSPIGLKVVASVLAVTANVPEYVDLIKISLTT